MRYRLRTLLILLAMLPPLLATGWLKYSEWNAARRAAERERQLGISIRIPALGTGPIAVSFPAATSSGVSSEEPEGQVLNFSIGITR